MADMIIKYEEEQLHEGNHTIVLNCVCQLNMRLNPRKCTFEVKTRKFLGFYLTEREIKANPNKCDTIINTETLSTK